MRFRDTYVIVSRQDHFRHAANIVKLQNYCCSSDPQSRKSADWKLVGSQPLLPNRQICKDITLRSVSVMWDQPLAAYYYSWIIQIVVGIFHGVFYLYGLRLVHNFTRRP